MNPDVLVFEGCLGRLHAELESGAAAAGPQFFWDGGRRCFLPPTESRSVPAELRAALARRFPAAAGISGAARRAWRRHARRHWEATAPFTSPALSGALLAFRRDAWAKVGPFDDGFRLYFEETDWLLRLAAAGLDSRFVPAAHAVHLFAQSTVHEPRATAWFAEAERRFRRRHYRAGVAKLLDVLGAAPPQRRDEAVRSSGSSPVLPLAELATPGAPAWIEIALAPGGFPAAGEPLQTRTGDWQMPDEIWRRLPPGGLWIRGVDLSGRESPPMRFERGGSPDGTGGRMNEPTGYTLRTYEPGDEAAIQRGFSEVFGVERSLAEWRWKFREPPQGSRIVLAFASDGELVCQYAAITVDIAWAGEPMQAAQIVDVFSRRRRGLGPRGGAFQRTMERFLADCAAAPGLGFVYGFPGERHQRAGAATGRYFEPLAIDRLQRTLQPLPGRSRTAGAGSRKASMPTPRAGSGCAADDRYPNATVRDAAWSEWRYERRPGGRYLQLGVRRAGEARAWGVLALTAAGGACWVDLLWDGERADDLADLAAAVEERARAHGASRVELWLRGDTEVRAALLERGYTGSPEPHLRLSAIAFDPRVSVPQVLERLYLTMGDCDHF